MDTNILDIFEQHKNLVFRLALNYTKSIYDAEDISQIVFIKLFENYARLEQGKEKAWLAKVTVNECKNLLKSIWRINTDTLKYEIVFETKEQNDI